MFNARSCLYKKSIRKLKQRQVNNADFLIVDNLNISDSDVSNEPYYNNKTIIRAKIILILLLSWFSK